MQQTQELLIEPLSKLPRCTVSVPGSKSITNRALVLAALTPMDSPLTLNGALKSEDTEVMVEALKALGFAIETHWDEAEPKIHFPFQERKRIPNSAADIYVANSGTTVRFLAAMLATGEGKYRLDGVQRMRERPIQDLIDALNQFEGVNVYSENDTGCPPIIIETQGMKGGHIKVKAGVSSQFLSALLMAAPFAENETTIEVVGPVVSEPYIAMTVEMMKQWDLNVIHNGNIYQILVSDCHNPRSYFIEPDASSASYFFAAAAITGGQVTVHCMKRKMLQGDVLFVDVLEKMGCRIEECNSGITVHGRPLKGIDVDMNAISDTVMTLAAVACFAEGSTTIRNVAHIRHKETDRISAVATELKKLGANVEEFEDGMTITPKALTGCAVETYNDHRMAMSLALVGLKTPGVKIKNPGCVAKTYPGFWQDLEQLRS